MARIRHSTVQHTDTSDIILKKQPLHREQAIKDSDCVKRKKTHTKSIRSRKAWWHSVNARFRKSGALHFLQGYRTVLVLYLQPTVQILKKEIINMSRAWIHHFNAFHVTFCVSKAVWRPQPWCLSRLSDCMFHHIHKTPAHLLTNVTTENRLSILTTLLSHSWPCKK